MEAIVFVQSLCQEYLEVMVFYKHENLDAYKEWWCPIYLQFTSCTSSIHGGTPEKYRSNEIRFCCSHSRSTSSWTVPNAAGVFTFWILLFYCFHVWRTSSTILSKMMLHNKEPLGFMEPKSTMRFFFRTSP